jgi:hypothetical protein
MKINYTGIIAEEQCMKAGSWQADEPVAHINVVKSLIAQVNEAMAENAKLCRELAEAREIIIKQKLQLTELEQQQRNLLEISVDDTKQKGVIGRENNQLHELLQQCLDVIRVWSPIFYQDAMERYDALNRVDIDSETPTRDKGTIPQ